MSENGKSHKIHWIKNLKRQGLKPIIELIEDDIKSFDEACDREIFYINEYKTNGFNLTNSESGGRKNKIMSEHTRKLMSESKKEYYKTNKVYVSDDTKELMKKSTIIRMSDPNERERLRIANKKYEDSKTEEQKINDILVQNCKSVIQYDKDMNFVAEYISIKEAVRKTGFHRSNIVKCCKGKLRTSSGFIWRYKYKIIN